MLPILTIATLAATLIGVRIEMNGALSFTRAELETALAARPPAAGAPITIEAFGGEVEVAREEKRRRVALQGRTGPEAARVVALVVWDLAQPEAVPPTLFVVAPARRGPSFRLALSGGVHDGVGPAQPLAGAFLLDVDVPLGGRFRGAVLASWHHAPRRNQGTLEEVTFDAWALRGGVGVELGPVALMLGPFVSPYYIETKLRHAGVVYGGSAWTQLGVPIGRGWFVRVTAGADVFARRVRIVSSENRLLAATPRLAYFTTAGLGWDFGR